MAHRHIGLWSLILSLALSALPQSVFALSDIDTYPHKSSITFLEDRGIISGYPDGTFRPNKAINRAEFLKLLMLSVYGSQAYQGGSGRCFTDFTGSYQWYWAHACTAKNIGIIHGYPDGSFRGEETIILAEALKMTLEAWDVPMIADNPDRPWYERYMDAAASKGVFKRFPYTPEYQMTRGEMALLLVMLDEPIAVLDPDAQTPNTTQVQIPLPTKASVCGNGVIEGTEQCDDGNTQTGDGCSDICILVAEPIRHGALRIEQQAISNADQASGNTDVTLFAFTAIAGRQDVYLTNLKLKSTVGSLGFAENYRLIIDRDGDGRVETLYGRATPSGETITFSDLNILVKDGAYSRVELWADIDTSHSTGNIAVGFDTSQSDFVEGVDKIDGEDVTGIKMNDSQCLLDDICWITVITSDSQTVSIQTQGNLYVTESTSAIGSRQIVASKPTPSLLLLTFRADAEPINVKQLAIEGVPSSVESLEFLIAGSSQPFATGRGINCDTIVSGRFCTDKDFTIPKGGEQLVVVRAVLKSDEFGAVSGQSFSLSLSSATSSTVAVKAEGGQSGQSLEQNNGNSAADGEVFIGTDAPAANSGITGPTHTILFAKIADITNSNTDADNTPITGGGMTFAQFAFRATDHSNTSAGPNSAEISKLVFTVSAVNMAFDASSLYLYNTQNSGVTSACSASGTTGTITVTCDNLDSNSIETAISPNDTIHLALHGTVTDAQLATGTSILQASLQNLSNPGITGTVQWNDGETTSGWVDIGKTNVKSTNYRLQ